MRDAPVTVQRATFTFVDPTRPTPPNGDYPGAPDRSLVTTVSFPARNGKAVRGPLPIVVFATGYEGDSLNYAPMYDHWVEAGYVVVAPTFPLSSKDAPGGPSLSDLASQPGDLSFILTEVLQQNRDTTSKLHGKLDPKRVGLAGKSLGAITAIETAFSSSARDDRFRAAIILTGTVGGSGPHFVGIDTPVLFEHGDADTTVPVAGSQNAYDQAQPPKYFVTLAGQTHSSAFGGGTTPPERVVARTTLDFLDGYVRARPAARARLLTDGNVPDVASIQHQI